MIIYGLMKYIEKIPVRYDFVMNLLTCGGLKQSHNNMLNSVRDNMEILDVGCGTGNFVIECAKRGARVTAIDASSQMLNVLREKIKNTTYENRIEIFECGSAVMDRYIKNKKFDLITASMMLGELPLIVRKKTIKLIADLVKPDGKILINDELWPEELIPSMIYQILFWIFFIPNFILTRTLIIPVKGLKKEIKDSDLEIMKTEKLFFGVITILDLKKNYNPSV